MDVKTRRGSLNGERPKLLRPDDRPGHLSARGGNQNQRVSGSVETLIKKPKWKDYDEESVAGDSFAGISVDPEVYPKNFHFQEVDRKKKKNIGTRKYFPTYRHQPKKASMDIIEKGKGTDNFRFLSNLRGNSKRLDRPIQDILGRNQSYERKNAARAIKKPDISYRWKIELEKDQILNRKVNPFEPNNYERLNEKLSSLKFSGFNNFQSSQKRDTPHIGLDRSKNRGSLLFDLKDPFPLHGSYLKSSLNSPFGSIKDKITKMAESRRRGTSPRLTLTKKSQLITAPPPVAPANPSKPSKSFLAQAIGQSLSNRLTRPDQGVLFKHQINNIKKMNIRSNCQI